MTNVWTVRFRKLRKEGLDAVQMEEVWKILSETKAFHYQWLEHSAREQFDEVMMNG